MELFQYKMKSIVRIGVKACRSSFLVLLAITVMFSSCLKEEDPVILPAPGNGEIKSLAMGEKYDKMIFFQLSTQNSYVADLHTWELGFEAAENGFHLIINGGTDMQIAETNSVFLDAVDQNWVSAAKWRWDSNSGHIDSTAFGQWRDSSGNSLRHVYIVDRGDSVPAAERYKKMILDEVNDTNYVISYANMDGSDLHFMVKIPKNKLLNFVRYSFKNGGKVVPVEPGKDNWDLLFTYYRHIFYDMTPVTPYRVCGVLINNGVEVAIDSTTNFYDIKLGNVQGLPYSTAGNAIGYKWKSINISSPSPRYEIKKYINYIIRDKNGSYFKLRFLDFYDENNIKGTPKFEFLRLS
jgi:hypothetical protein